MSLVQLFWSGFYLCTRGQMLDTCKLVTVFLEMQVLSISDECGQPHTSVPE